jgi:hypothetical protein
MPDIYCPKCGEPWDADELHDVPAINPDRGAGVLTYEQAAKLFPVYGCGLWIDRFDGGAFTPCTAPVVDPDAAEYARAMHEITPHPDEWLM